MARARPRRVCPPAPERAPLNAQLLALDPGVIHPAAARFSGGRLMRAARTPVAAGWARLGTGQRALEIARATVQWNFEVEHAHTLVSAYSRKLPDVTHVIYEFPQIYRETKAAGVRPNDLTKILAAAATTVGMVAARCDTLAVFSPFPADVWDRMPKATEGDPRDSVRGGRVWDRLDEAERAVLELTHDAFDACGLGLFLLGRFERVRVFAGAT